jgi:hypothetical protein
MIRPHRAGAEDLLGVLGPSRGISLGKPGASGHNSSALMAPSPGREPAPRRASPALTRPPERKVIRVDRRRGSASPEAEKRFKNELLLARQA